MRDISENELRRLDLTLLMVLDGALRHRKLTAVAQQLGLTQPAISHALTRLRDILGDPLFVRRANGVQPTPRALALAQPVAQALATLRDALQQGRRFDPGTAAREFRIAALDYAIAMLVPDFLARFSTIAPGCRLAFRSLGYEEGRAALAHGSIDLSRLRALIGEDDDFVRELCQAFVSTTDEILPRIEKAVATGDRATLASAAHKLKGGSQSICAERIAVLALALERGAPSRTLQELSVLLADLRQEIARCVEFLRDTVH